MKKTLGIVAGLSVLALMPFSAEAHRSWLLPSAAQVEGKAPWVTIDAATSEGIFDFDSFPLKLDGLVITGPDGKPVTPEAPLSGHLRSTFDLQLNQTGTYKISVVNAAVMGSYMLNGQMQRFRGTEDEAAKLPAEAQGLKLSRMYSRFDTFVTSGKGNDTALAPTGKGLEMVPVTHPSDMVAGEPATFRFLIDGKPLANLAVLVIPGGARFRNGLKEQQVTTDANGEVTVKWAMAGDYLVTANYPPRPQGAEGAPEGGKPSGDQGGKPSGDQGGKPSGEQGGKPSTDQGGKPAGQDGPGMGGMGGGRGDMPERRYSYTATFEVLPN